MKAKTDSPIKIALIKNVYPIRDDSHITDQSDLTNKNNESPRRQSKIAQI